MANNYNVSPIDAEVYDVTIIKGDKGDKGDTGSTPDISIGTVTTLSPGSNATVSLSGTPEQPVMSFGIPQGDKGDTGDTGATGKSAYQDAVDNGYTGTQAQFGTYLANVASDLAEIENITATAATLPAGSNATASYSAGLISLGIPKGDKGDTGNGDMIADDFSTSTAYAIGDYAIYNGHLYRFTAAHAAGAWTGTDAVQVQLAEDVADLKSAITYVTPEMYGAKGDGVTDDSTAFNNAIASGSIIIASKSYHVDAPISIGSGKTVIITGRIESSADAIYVNGYGTKVFANEIVAADACIKIANVSSCEHCYFQLYKLTGKYGVVYDGTSWGQYITFMGGRFDCSVHCIHIEHPSDSTGWFNAIYFHDVKCMGTAEYGVYVINQSTNKGLLNGDKFINCGFENQGNAIYLNNVSFFSFSNSRIQEITGNNKVLVFEGKNEYVEFHTTDTISIRRIDISANTGDNNQIIAPLTFRDGSGMTYHAYVDKAVITYELRRSRQLNVTSDITMNVDSTVFAELPICDVFTFRDTETKRTLTLSPQYGVKGITTIKVVVVGTVSFKILDSSGHTVTDRNNATAGTYIFFSDGTGWWSGGKLS